MRKGKGKQGMGSGLRQSFTYGAVYFRKSNPPRADWARDYATAALFDVRQIGQAAYSASKGAIAAMWLA